MNLVDITGSFTIGDFLAQRAWIPSFEKTQQNKTRIFCTAAYVTDKTLLATTLALCYKYELKADCFTVFEILFLPLGNIAASVHKENMNVHRQTSKLHYFFNHSLSETVSPLYLTLKLQYHCSAELHHWMKKISFIIYEQAHSHVHEYIHAFSAPLYMCNLCPVRFNHNWHMN